VLFTDFGLHGPYTGQMKAVLHQMAPGIPVVDLFADAPVGNPKPSAYLLAAHAAWFAAGTLFLCVVDPGVGGTPPAIILEADGRRYVGPGNGLFELVRRSAFWYENSNGLAEIAIKGARGPGAWSFDRCSGRHRPLNEGGIHHSFKSMRKPTRQPQETDRSKPKKRHDLLLATGNKRLAEQVRKILGKHYASKYRVR